MQNRPHPALNATVTGVLLASLLMAAAPVTAQAPVDDGRPNRPDIRGVSPCHTVVRAPYLLHETDKRSPVLRSIPLRRGLP